MLSSNSLRDERMVSESVSCPLDFVLYWVLVEHNICIAWKLRRKSESLPPSPFTRSSVKVWLDVGTQSSVDDHDEKRRKSVIHEDEEEKRKRLQGFGLCRQCMHHQSHKWRNETPVGEICTLLLVFYFLRDVQELLLKMYIIRTSLQSGVSTRRWTSFRIEVTSPRVFEREWCNAYQQPYLEVGGC